MNERADPTEEAAARLAERSIWSAQQRTLEADLRSDLAQVLVPFALNVIGLPAEAIRQEGSGLAGRFDSMFGSAIIEYKAPGRLRVMRERQIAAKQALGYLEDDALGARVVVVTDGELWGILRDIDADPEIGEQLTFDLREGADRLVPPIAGSRGAPRHPPRQLRSWTSWRANGPHPCRVMRSSRLWGPAARKRSI